MTDEAAVEAPERQEPQARHPAERRVARQAEGGTSVALRIYKPGQGYYTRLGTTLGIGVLSVWGAKFLLDELATLSLTPAYVLPVQWGVVVGFLVLMSVLTYWITGLNRRTNDFFIATEGEMKKVRWSTRKELVRSTKVVILTVIILGVFLFVFDLLFMVFFGAIGVLKASTGWERLFGSGS